ncbi:MAG: GHMP kinase, partial [Thermoprotei archaeon]
VRGLDVVVNSEVAVAAGLASSAAVEVTFLGLLNEVFDLGLSRKDIAEISYTAEHDIMKIPCGRLDQYGCVFGGILVIYCRPPYDVEEIVKEYNFVVLDSGIRHATADVHPRRQSEIDEGLKILMEDPDVPEDIKKKLGYRYFEPKWEELREDELMPYLDKLPPKSRDRILFTLRVHESTMMALSMLKGEIYTIEEAHQFMRGVSKDAIELAKDAEKKWGSELAIIGLVMNYQHEMLRDLYEVSLPELERIRDAALQAGALGVKISGAGLGGSLIALVPSEKAGDKVLRAGIKAGARRGWVVKIDEGLRREV